METPVSYAEECLGFKLPEGWQVHTITRDGRQAGFALVKDNEVHAWREPTFTGRWGTRQDIERVIQPLLDQYGHVTTKVTAKNPVGNRFVTRLGFVKTHEQDGINHYRADRINHARL